MLGASAAANGQSLCFNPILVLGILALGSTTAAARQRATMLLILLSALASAGAFAQELPSATAEPTPLFEASESPFAAWPALQSTPAAQTPPAEQTSPEQSKPPEPENPDQANPPAQTNPAKVGPAENAAVKSVELFNLLDKKSIVFPDIASTTVALSPGQKFELFIDNSISIHSILWAALGSLIGQAADSPTGFGVGASGYPKRFSTSLARQSSGEFFGTFVLASALHEDPRFFPQFNPAFKQSIKYSVHRLFFTRSDSGNQVVNVSGLVGPLLGESLANVYWPDRNRTVGDTLFRYGLDLSARVAGNMFRNYWPVLFAKIRHAPPESGGVH
jgi:hypothetical protein